MRTRGLLRVLSQELFGADLTLPALPRLKSLRGLGISDSDVYAGRLEEKFGYRNTFFHREPRLDMANAPEGEFGQYDFIVSAEVFEHVAPPVEAAFANVYRMLRPNGVFVFSVPYSLEDTTLEHFPELHEFTVARVGDRYVLVNRTREGEMQFHENLVFHGGPGSVLEMRLFSESDLRRMLSSAGFGEVRVYGDDCRKFGIVYDSPCSLPIAARKGEFGWSRETAGELLEQWSGFMRSRWVRLGAKLGLMRGR